MSAGTGVNQRMNQGAAIEKPSTPTGDDNCTGPTTDSETSSMRAFHITKHQKNLQNRSRPSIVEAIQRARTEIRGEERPLSGAQATSTNGTKKKRRQAASGRRGQRKPRAKAAGETKGPAKMDVPTRRNSKCSLDEERLAPSGWPDIFATPTDSKGVRIIDDILDFERKRARQMVNAVSRIGTKNGILSTVNRISSTADNDKHKCRQ